MKLVWTCSGRVYYYIRSYTKKVDLTEQKTERKKSIKISINKRGNFLISIMIAWFDQDIVDNAKRINFLL